MSLALFMDVHVQWAITESLRNRGVDVLTAQDEDAESWPDEELLERAVELKRILFTQDRDFLRIAAEWQRTGRSFPGIVFGAQTAVSVGVAVECLELIAVAGRAEEFANLVQYIPFSN